MAVGGVASQRTEVGGRVAVCLCGEACARALGNRVDGTGDGLGPGGTDAPPEPVKRIDPFVSGVYVLWSRRPKPVVGPAARAERARVADRAAICAAPGGGAASVDPGREGCGPGWPAARSGPVEVWPKGQSMGEAGPGGWPGGQVRAAVDVEASRAGGWPGGQVRAEGPGFVYTATRFPLAGARPALLVGPALRLPGRSAWRAALPWLLREGDRDRSGGAVFLDVESTGLARAAGTVAFVIGIAALAEDAVVVEQWLLSRLSDEGAMLAAVARRLTEARAEGAPLVTFNGASFDLPLLRARLRRHGQVEAPLAGAHLDLLPVARRLWRGRGPDCRLATLEERQLGALRLGDIPGHAIPEAFWAALRRPHDAGARQRIRQVCAHNLVDVLTMPALALQMAEAVAAPTDLELALRSADHLNAIGRRPAAAAMLEPWAAGLGGRGPAAAMPSAERRALLRAADLLRREGRLLAAAGLRAAASAGHGCSERSG